MRYFLVRMFVVGSACVVVLPSASAAQDQPVVFVHGIGSSPETWAGAAGRLQSRLHIAPERPQVSWRSFIESQSEEVQSALRGLPTSTVAVGHSLGGLVVREWSRRHGVEGIVTLATPNRGAPMANHVHEWVGFNYSLLAAMGNAFNRLGNVSYGSWWWLFSAVEGALNWGGYIADFSLRHLLIELGMQVGAPFVQQVAVGSPYLDNLNGGNLGREAAEIPNRVAIVNAAYRYWDGGPFRLLDPENGDHYALATTAAAVGLEYWGFRIFSEADPLDTDAHALAFALWDAAFWLWNFDEFWCRTVSDDRPLWSARCFPNDGFIPTWSQFYPGGTLNLEVQGGPVHTRETRNFDDALYAILTGVMHVPPREEGGPPPPPPPPPPGPTPDPPDDPGPGSDGRGDVLSPDASLSPGGSISSTNGRFSLIYQDDGNLVLYRNDGVALWHSGTAGVAPGRAIMQLDGNFVVYDASGTPRWASGTAGFEAAQLIVQDDGNLVMYSAAGGPIWATGTRGL